MANANSADPDQTAPKGAVWSGSTLFAIPLSSLQNNCIEKQNLGQKKVSGIKCEILGLNEFIKLLDEWQIV